MPTSTAAQMTAAATRTDPLCLVTDLYLIDGTVNANKFHRSILVGNIVLVRYGRRGDAGASGMKKFDTPEAACAYYWTLLRSKVGKGYHVENAIVCDLALDQIQGLHGNANLWNPKRNLEYEADTVLHQHRTRRTLEYAPAAKVKSPRTAKQGKDVLLTLRERTPDSEALIKDACSPDSEKFMRFFALSHPACPEEAEVVAALAGDDWTVTGW